MATHRSFVVAQITAVELADAVVAEAGPALDGAGSGLQAYQAHREVHACGVAAVAVVGDSHGVSLFVLFFKFGKNIPNL